MIMIYLIITTVILQAAEATVPEAIAGLPAAAPVTAVAAEAAVVAVAVAVPDVVKCSF